MNYGSNAYANWLWKDLYVWPQGRMAPSAYLGGLARVLIVYVVIAQILSIVGLNLLGTINNGETLDLFEGIKWGQVLAVVLIAFPAWSLFQRRFNDMRPDLREKLYAWSVGFPLVITFLVGLMIAQAAGIDLPFEDFGRIRFAFVLMLFGAAFVPGGDAALVQKGQQQAKPKPDTFMTAAQKASRDALAAQIASKPAGRHLPTAHTDRPKPTVAPAFPQVITRTRNLPPDGRVKPGWFS